LLIAESRPLLCCFGGAAVLGLALAQRVELRVEAFEEVLGCPVVIVL
jgi:hypothetical protein